MVLHWVSEGKLSLDEACHNALTAGFDTAMTLLDLESFFRHRKTVGVGADAASRHAVDAMEAQRTRWPLVLRDYNVDGPQPRHTRRRRTTGGAPSAHSDVAMDPHDPWSAAWRGRGRGRLLGEGGHVVARSFALRVTLVLAPWYQNMLQRW